MPARSSVKLLSVAAAVAIAYAVHAATPAETQKARHDHYKELGAAFKAIRDETRADSPDFAKLEQAAATVQKASENQIQWFPKGTGAEAGKTRALPEIWSDPTGFEAAMKTFEERAPGLVSAVKSKDVEAVKTAFGNVGKACGGCHDKFRGPE